MIVEKFTFQFRKPSPPSKCKRLWHKLLISYDANVLFNCNNTVCVERNHVNCKLIATGIQMTHKYIFRWLAVCLVYPSNLIWFETRGPRPQSKCLVSFLLIDFLLSAGEWWVMFQCYINAITFHVRSLSHGQRASASTLTSLALCCLCLCFYLLPAAMFSIAINNSLFGSLVTFEGRILNRRKHTMGD